MSQDTERLSDETLMILDRTYPAPSTMGDLAREVQASRKLIADLRATHATAHSMSLDGVVRMIDEAGL